MLGLIRLFTIITLSLLLYACGGGSADSPWDGTTGDGTTGDGATGDGTTGDGTTPEETAYYLGSGSGASFTQGTLNIGVSSLSAGGQTTVTANIADVDGNLYQDSASVSFTSTCVASSLASITSPVTSSTGVVVANYEAQGCSGSDTITATTTVNGATRTATGSLTVQPAVIGSMQFVSASPSIIGIRGFGLTEVAQVVFKVLDTNGNPVANEEVNFTLSTTLGGVTIPNTTDTSDANGLVRADVQSGTVASTVRVTATLASNPTISTQSDGLTISTGIADQNSISLSLSERNPESLGIDGVEVDVTVHAADHFNNPVPDGTAITFTTEGGQIESQCLTSNGRCSVVWTSSNPRPPSTRSTILATMLGEESFVDANGNGVLDSSDTYTDMPEAFRDDDENGSFGTNGDSLTASSEEFLDFNSSETYNSADNEYNGVLCCDSDTVTGAVSGEACFGKTPTSYVCSTSKNIHVRDSGVIVMASTTLTIETSAASLNGAGETLDTMTAYVFNDVDGSGTLTAGDQIPPAGTVISVGVNNGNLESLSSYTVPDTNADSAAFPYGAYSLPIRWRGDDTTSAGSLNISAKVPSGLVNGPIYIDITD